jgi:MFS family permease
VSKDAAYIISGGFIRSMAVSLISVTYGLYIAFLGLSPFQLGFLIAAGLIGMAVATYVVLLWGDKLGRRRLMLALAVLGAAGGISTAYSSEFAAFIVSAFIGMINGMGRDRGAAAALDQAMLASVVTDSSRTRFFAFHSFAQDLGHAVGSALAALPVILQNWFSVDLRQGYEGTIIIYSAILLLSGLFAVKISNRAENSHQTQKFKLDTQTRRRVLRISTLFGVDALGSGFLTGALIAYYFHERFNIGAAEIGSLIAAARVANAVSHFGAAWIASKIGLVRTMVFTHLPAHFLLVAMAFVPDFWMAAALFLLHECLVEMDVPTRQSYVMAIIQPNERTAVAAITQMVRVAGWGVSPVVAGALMSSLSINMPLYMGAGIKALYDIGLFFNFRDIPAPEELQNKAEAPAIG